MKATWQKRRLYNPPGTSQRCGGLLFSELLSLGQGSGQTDWLQRSFYEGRSDFFFLKAIAETDRYFFLILDPNGKIIGETVINAIDWDLSRANFHIFIFHPAERGKGIGSWAVEVSQDFAFDQLHLHRLELDVFSFNPRAKKAYLRAGFKREGVLRDAVLDRGQYAEDIIMAILEDDWLKLKES